MQRICKIINSLKDYNRQIKREMNLNKQNICGRVYLIEQNNKNDKQMLKQYINDCLKSVSILNLDKQSELFSNLK